MASVVETPALGESWKLERLPHFKMRYFDCNAAIQRYRAASCSKPHIHQHLRSRSLSLSLSLSSTLLLFPSNPPPLFSFYSSVFEAPPTEQAVIANDCFLRVQSHLGSLTDLRLEIVQA